MSLPQEGFGKRAHAGRRKATAMAAVVIVAVVGWSFLVLSWDGGEKRATVAPEDTRAERSAVQGSTSEPSRREDRRGKGAVPDEAAYAATPEDPQEHLAGGAQMPVEAPASLPPRPRDDHPEGAGNASGSHDPLGAGAFADDLAEIDQERVRFTAAKFVSTAYGYSGKDTNRYNRVVGENVVWPDFFSTAGGEEISRYAGRVKQTGTRSAAKLTRFEVEDVESESVTGHAYFETGESYGSNGELTGELHPYRQDLTLQRSGATWKVRAAGRVEEV